MDIENMLRADVLLKELGIAKSRNQAQTMIKMGYVKWNNKIVDKPSKLIDENNLEILKDLKYVGRGALKIEKALQIFDIDISNKICMDVGASTGGFTQVLLNNGASTVYAIDVGTDQLDFRLREDKRVISMEGTNFRYIDLDKFGKIDLISIDVSFISSKYILPNAVKLLDIDGDIILLLKPQFEANKGFNKKGVIKNKNVHINILSECVEFIKNIGCFIADITFSPITGSEGNIEYLLHIRKKDTKNNNLNRENIKKLVNEAFN